MNEFIRNEKEEHKMKSTQLSICECIELCDLPLEQARERRLMIEKSMMPHVIEAVRFEGGRSWFFAYSDSVDIMLEDLVQVEGQCCSTLSWSLEQSSENRQLVLTVKGFAESKEVRRSLWARIPRLLTAGSVGFLGAVVVCCIVPILITLVVGATIAAPLMILDSPAFMVILGLRASISMPIASASPN